MVGTATALRDCCVVSMVWFGKRGRDACQSSPRACRQSHCGMVWSSWTMKARTRPRHQNSQSSAASVFLRNGRGTHDNTEVASLDTSRSLHGFAACFGLQPSRTRPPQTLALHSMEIGASATKRRAECDICPAQCHTLRKILEIGFLNPPASHQVLFRPATHVASSQ